jgi:hypothetical protein
MDNTEKLVQIVDAAGYFATDTIFEPGTTTPLEVTTYAQVREAVCKAYRLGKEETQTEIKQSYEKEIVQLKNDIRFLANMYADYVKQSNEFSLEMTDRLVAEILR